MLHPGALSQKKWKKRVYLQLFKLLEYQYKVDFHATDEEEAEFIRNYFDEPAKVFVAGNFPNKMELLPLPDKQPGKLKMATIAIISEMKNILLVLEALEKVTDEVEYHLHGPLKSEDYWDLCKHQIRQLPSNIKVEYHKEIEPERVKEVLLANHIFVLPSKSENFGHAIYEALSAGRPVITSRYTPWNDLQESKAGVNVSTDFTIELSEAIHFFAGMDLGELQEWSKGAFEYAERAVDLEEIREGYGRMFLM
jgi:glycosyltransferase involved in cell wall biosynthesis